MEKRRNKNCSMMDKVINYLENHVFATRLQKQKVWRITDKYAKELDDEIEEFEKAILILKRKQPIDTKALKKEFMAEVHKRGI